MRRAPVIAAVIALAAGLAACGYEGQTTASPETVEGSVPTETTPTETTDTTDTETTDRDHGDRDDGDDHDRDHAGSRG